MSRSECLCVACVAGGKRPCMADRWNERPVLMVERFEQPAFELGGINIDGQVIDAGTTVYEFRGPTYGCIGWDEVAVSLTGTYTYPFIGVPRSFVQAVPS